MVCSPILSSPTHAYLWRGHSIALIVLKYQGHFISIDALVFDRAGDPAVCGIRLPAARADRVLVRHAGGGGGLGGCLVVVWI